MKTSKRSTIEDYLKLNFQDDKEDLWLTNSYTLRKLVGVLGMVLPFLLFLFLYLDNGYSKPLPSISHYYYTRVSPIFIIVISLMAIFLIVYKGKERIDFYTSVFSGVFALLLILFPTDNLTDICSNINLKHSVTILNKSDFRTMFHYVSAGIFLLGLAFMSLFLFTKSSLTPKERGKEKRTRNRIYRTCGVIMIAAILVMGAGAIGLIPKDTYEGYQLTFWMETIAVESFGFSWLIKGETFFKDKVLKTSTL